MTWMFDKAFLERLELDAYDAHTIAKRVGVPLEVVDKFFAAQRRYRVQSNLEYGWVAGKDGEDQPTLVFVGRPRFSAENVDPLSAISFDLKTGKVTTRSVQVDDEGGLDDSEYVLGMLEDELGFVHLGHADVLAFKYPSVWHYAVVPLPFHLHDTIVGTDDADLDVARAWIRRGDYVLHCGNAYFMSSSGAVESS